MLGMLGCQTNQPILVFMTQGQPYFGALLNLRTFGRAVQLQLEVTPGKCTSMQTLNPKSELFYLRPCALNSQLVTKPSEASLSLEHGHAVGVPGGSAHG